MTENNGDLQIRLFRVNFIPTDDVDWAVVLADVDGQVVEALLAKHGLGLLHGRLVSGVDHASLGRRATLELSIFWYSSASWRALSDTHLVASLSTVAVTASILFQDQVGLFQKIKKNNSFS
jgi:hypothetical protein